MMMSRSSIQGNQTLKLAFDDRWLDNKEDDNFNVDIIEKAGLSNTIKTDNENDDQQNNRSIFIQCHIFNNNLQIIIRNLIA